MMRQIPHLRKPQHDEASIALLLWKAHPQAGVVCFTITTTITKRSLAFLSSRIVFDCYSQTMVGPNSSPCFGRLLLKLV
jgi:hypothetical protein